MAINYVEKGAGLHDAVRAAGHWLEEHDGVWRSDNDVAVQAIIDAYDPLPDVKKAKRAAIRADGLVRIQANFPAIADFDFLQLEAERWQSLRATAKQTTANYQRLIDIYTAGATAISQVNAATTIAQVNAVTAAWPA